jgi:hypothetical protein
MGSASSALNSIENEIAQRELAKPLDGSDVAHSPTAALEEVKRLRKELRRCLDKEEFKKRKENNKWRRGSFGQISKAEDYWDLQEKKAKDEEKAEGPKAEEIGLDNVEEMMAKMSADMNVVLAPTPLGGGAGAEATSAAADPPKKKKSQRRSFVLEAGLTLVESDDEEA